ncbi:MAG: GNAT family N-acetyltransferase [Propionibacteriaceae bacterium]|jgi:GNAT superfamily N-acetyltransferase|nr:GNAT family N-acetyltransferase [Propionibacteriaceae bacterium]
MIDSFLGIAWENVIIGLLGGFIVSAIFFLTRRVREWLLQRKYPVAGEYISKYEDLVDGKRVMVAAPATLKQRGRHIEGTTIMDGREWILSGELSNTGYIHGVYSAADPLDQGVGNFFLRVSVDHRLDGLWSGYDSANDSIASGRYIFMPVNSSLVVRDRVAEDRLALLRIADEELGQGYFDDETASDADHVDDHFIKVAEIDGKLAGFAYCMIQDWPSAEHVIRASAPRHLRHATVIGVLKTVAVKHDQQSRGIGTALCLACLDEFRRRGVQAVYSVAWRNGDTINIGGILERANFTPFATVEDYWAEDSLQQGYDCPTCGSPPCHCAAVMYSTIID